MRLLSPRHPHGRGDFLSLRNLQQKKSRWLQHSPVETIHFGANVPPAFLHKHLGQANKFFFFVAACGIFQNLTNNGDNTTISD